MAIFLGPKEQRRLFSSEGSHGSEDSSLDSREEQIREDEALARTLQEREGHLDAQHQTASPENQVVEIPSAQPCAAVRVRARPSIYASVVFFAIIWIIAFIFTMSHATDWNLDPYEQNPWIGPSAENLKAVGLTNTMSIRFENQWWRLLTAPFISAGILQLLLNIAILLPSAPPLEKAYGITPVLFIFVSSGLIAAAWSSLLVNKHMTTSSTAAALGVLGAFLLEYLQFPRREWSVWRAAICILLLCTAVALAPFVPYVDLIGNMTGLISGVTVVKHVCEPVAPLSNIGARFRFCRNSYPCCVAFTIFVWCVMVMLPPYCLFLDSTNCPWAEDFNLNKVACFNDISPWMCNNDWVIQAKPPV